MELYTAGIIPTPCPSPPLPPVPLRISKRQTQTTVQARQKGSSTLPSSNIPSFAIPRRRSSCAFRSLSHCDEVSKPSLDKPSPLSRSKSTGNRVAMYAHPARVASSGGMRHRYEENERPHDPEVKDNHPANASKTSLLSRVKNVLDFGKTRGPLDRGARCVTEPGPLSDRGPMPYRAGVNGHVPRVNGFFMPHHRVGPPDPPLTPALTVPDLHIPKNRSNIEPWSPRRLPITTAKVEMMADILKISVGQELSTWVSLEVTATTGDVDGGLGGNMDFEVPIDAMVIVDNSTRMPPNIFRGICRNAMIVVSALDMLIDRLAIGCISKDPEPALDILLPLSSHGGEVARGAIRSVRMPYKDLEEPGEFRLSRALQEASNMLQRAAGKRALPHIFVLTTATSIAVPDSNEVQRVRFHTISPETLVKMHSSELMDGWHLSASVDEDDQEGELTLRSKLKDIIRHLRMGMDSGVLSNLFVKLDAGEGCSIETVLGETQYSSLRPGETLTLLIKVRAYPETPPLSRQGDDSGDTSRLDSGQNVYEMIDQIEEILSLESPLPHSRTLLTATLEYRHSALPSGTIVSVERRCDVTRFPQEAYLRKVLGPPNGQHDDSEGRDPAAYRKGKPLRKGMAGRSPAPPCLLDENWTDEHVEVGTVDGRSVRVVSPFPQPESRQASGPILLSGMNAFRDARERNYASREHSLSPPIPKESGPGLFRPPTPGPAWI